MRSKEVETNFKVLKDENVEKEVKVFLILSMLGNDEISLNKAKELCTECGIFSDHWIAIDAQATDIFSKTYASM